MDGLGVRRSALPEAFKDLDAWPVVDQAALDETRRGTYQRRERAVRAWIAGVTLTRIEAETGVRRATLMRLLRAAIAPAADGRIEGFRALIPHRRRTAYRRLAALPRRAGPRGYAGALGRLFAEQPQIRQLVDDFLRKRRRAAALHEAGFSVRSLHKRFLDACRTAGLADRGVYPFTTATLGYPALARYVKASLASGDASVVRAVHGEEVAKKLKSGDGRRRPALEVLWRVECDAHHLDGIFTAYVPSPLGTLVAVPIRRLWVIVVIEVASRAVLGYHLSIRQECDALDVLRAIGSSLSRWQPRQLQVPEMTYAAGAALPSFLRPQFVGLCWDEFSVDAALANLSGRVADKLMQVVGCAAPRVLPRHLSDDRAYIERLFKTIETDVFHRLPNTTGSAPADPRRTDPTCVALRRGFLYQHLEDLVDVAIANYNATPHGSIEHRTPLEHFAFLVDEASRPLRRAHPSDVQRLTAQRFEVKVAGGAATGRAPFVRLLGARYGGPQLKGARVAGQRISVEANLEDLRVLRAFAPDGAEIGTLRAMPPWHRSPHSLMVRQAVNSLVHRRLLHLSMQSDPVHVLLDYLGKQPASKKHVPPVYLELMRIIERETTLADPYDEPPDGLLDESRDKALPMEAAPAPPRHRAESRRSEAAPSKRPLPPMRMALNGRR